MVFSIYPWTAVVWGSLELDRIMESKHDFRVMHRHSPVWMMSVNNTGLYIYFHVFHCRPLTLFHACKGERPSFLASLILCILCWALSMEPCTTIVVSLKLTTWGVSFPSLVDSNTFSLTLTFWRTSLEEQLIHSANVVWETFLGRDKFICTQSVKIGTDHRTKRAFDWNLSCWTNGFYWVIYLHKYRTGVGYKSKVYSKLPSQNSKAAENIAFESWIPTAYYTPTGISTC